jgi:large subunit ribosomal protein L15
MKYHELNATPNRPTKRVGRGIAAGQGKTAGRGTKGQKSRTGHAKLRAGFMGGQRAIMQAVPKLKGFKSLSSKAEIVYTDVLGSLAGKVDNFVLADKSLISSPYVKVKIIARGDITAKVDVSTQSASKTAIAAITKAGGSFTKVTVPQRAKKSDD